MKRNNSGFTMVELLVTVAVSSIVLAAAASLMLLGLRVHQTTQKEAGEQQTVRIVLSALEDLSASGKIYRVQPLSDGWQLQGKTADGKSGAVLLRYKSGKLTSGTSGDQVLLDNLRGARVDLDGSLVTFTFATAAHSYSTSVFCRTGIEGDSVGKAEAQKKLDKLKNQTLPVSTTLTEAQKKARFEFLKTLAGQLDSKGEIKNTDTYFSNGTSADTRVTPAGTNTPPGAPASSRGERRSSPMRPSTAIRPDSQTWTKAWRVSRMASGATPMTPTICPSPATTSFLTGTGTATPTTSARCCAWMRTVTFTPSRATAAAGSPSTATRRTIRASWATAC